MDRKSIKDKRRHENQGDERFRRTLEEYRDWLRQVCDRQGIKDNTFPNLNLIEMSQNVVYMSILAGMVLAQRINEDYAWAICQKAKFPVEWTHDVWMKANNDYER